MNSNNSPSKEEVMGWNPESLSDYMRRLKLSGCDKMVMKGNITGAQFMQMTEYDLQVFPRLYLPIITKIQKDINKEDQKGGFGHTLKAHRYPIQGKGPLNLTMPLTDKDVWDSDEFDNDSDHDYEGADQEEEDGYICAMTEPQAGEQQDSDKGSECNYKAPASSDIVKPRRHLREATIQDYPSRDPDPAERISKPPFPLSPTMIHTRQGPLYTSATQHIDRSKKPGQPAISWKDFPTSKGSTVKAPGTPTSKIPQPSTPKPRDVPNRASKLVPCPPMQSRPAILHSSIPGQDLDPSWYGGKITRHQAEVALRDVNKDGAFVVRDSSKGFTEHPYTLMLLKQGKIYNIKIRNQGNSYSLGSGINNTKSFPGVKELITHHTHTPLLLIDARDQSSEAQSQSCLLYPAGL